MWIRTQSGGYTCQRPTVNPDPVRSTIENLKDTAKMVTFQENIHDKRRYSNYFRISDFKSLPQFFIETGHFYFDSHNADLTDGWELIVKQTFNGQKARRPVIRLLDTRSSRYDVDSGIRIYPPSDRPFNRINTLEDAVAIFQTNFELMLNSRFRMQTKPAKVKSLESYTDDELLAEVNARTKARLNGYNGVRKPVVVRDLTNVIDFDTIKRTPIAVDEVKLNKMLSA